MTNATQENKSALLTSPVGEINFLAHLEPRKDNFTGKMNYSARIEIDKNAKNAEAFLKQIRKINKNLGSDEGTKQEGNYFVNAKSKSQPKVLDKNGKVLSEEEIPMIEGGSARLILKPFASKNEKMGGGLSLVAIQLFDVIEYTGGVEVDEDEVLAALKDAS